MEISSPVTTSFSVKSGGYRPAFMPILDSGTGVRVAFGSGLGVAVGAGVSVEVGPGVIVRVGASFVQVGGNSEYWIVGEL